MFTEAIERSTTYALGEKIPAAIQDNDERHIEDVIAALLNTLVTVLSLVPASDGKPVVEEIGRCLPLMLEAAGQVAAGRSPPPSEMQ